MNEIAKLGLTAIQQPVTIVDMFDWLIREMSENVILATCI